MISKFVGGNIFSSESLKTCDNIVSKNLEISFVFFLEFIVANSKISDDRTLNPGSPHNGLSWSEFDRKGLESLHVIVKSLLQKFKK